MNWTKIAEKCNTTSGAAAKRYSRMKQAFDQGAAPPGASASRSPAKNTPTKAKTTPKSTPRKSKAATSSGDDQVAATPTPKRKRATPLKKMAAAEAQTFKADPEDEDDANVSDEEHTPKRAKGTKGKAKTNGAVIDKKQKDTELLTPTTEATTIIKGEHDEGDGDNDEDTFYDAHERVEDLADTDVDADARKSFPPSQSLHHLLLLPFFPSSLLQHSYPTALAP